MPVSKKPRTKRKPAANAPGPLRIPTRRVRESYAESTPLEVRRQALDEANAALEKGVKTGLSRLCIAAAYKALELSPLCTDAYNLLAEEITKGPEDALDIYRRAIHAGELALGPEAFERERERFDGLPEAKPYLTARYMAADMLLEMEREEEAMEHLRALLELSPQDEHGARYGLLSYSLDQHDLEPARKLLASYPHEQSTVWLYSRALLAYRDEQQATAVTAAILASALAANAHVPALLAGEWPKSYSTEELAKPGSVEEAMDYVESYDTSWTGTPGAVSWLLSAT